MNNLPLTYVSVCERMSKNVHTLAYAGPIRCSVTGHLGTDHYFSTGGVPILVRQHTILFSHSAVSNDFFSLFIHANKFF